MRLSTDNYGELTYSAAKTQGPFSATLFPFGLTSDSFSNEGFLWRNFQEQSDAVKVKKILLNLVEDYLISNKAYHSKIHKTYIENVNNEMGNHIKI